MDIVSDFLIQELSEKEKGCLTCQLPSNACNTDRRCPFSTKYGKEPRQLSTDPRAIFHRNRYRQKATERRIAKKANFVRAGA